MKRTVLIALLVFAAGALGEAEMQTDWQGGPGVLGPVTDWGDTFHIAGDMDWDTEPGQLKLIVNKSENQITTADGPTYVIAVDMDQDGDEDIAGCAYNSGMVYWVKNVNGSGTQFTKYTIGSVSNPRFISTGDYDNNGYRDIAVSSGSANTITIFSSTPSGWSTANVIATNFDARQLRSADINEDGYIDIIGVSSYSGDVCWWENDGTSTSWNQHYIDGALIGAHACDMGDFNGDGHLDIVAGSSTNGDICAYMAQSPYGYSWNRMVIETSYSNLSSLSCADFNNDGSTDFAASSASGSGNLRWYDYLDTASYWVSTGMDGAYGQQITDIDASDMDGDGYADILLACMGEDKVIWCKNREYLGQDWLTSSVSDNFNGASGVSVGDMDSDGVLDVIACAFYGDKNSWWRVSGFTSPSLLTSSILNIQPPDPNMAHWDYVHWSTTLPPQTSVMVRLKTSYDSASMGTWSSWITSPADLSSLVSQGGSFVQYQVRLATSNPNVTPSLKDISILWDPVSVEGGTSGSLNGRRVWLTSGNPVSGAFSVGYRVDQPGMVSIAVYDVSGRTVHTVNDGDLEIGEYSAMITGLPAGTYAIVMQSPDGMAAQRVVVTR